MDTHCQIVALSRRSERQNIGVVNSFRGKMRAVNFKYSNLLGAGTCKIYFVKCIISITLTVL